MVLFVIAIITTAARASHFSYRNQTSYKLEIALLSAMSAVCMVVVIGETVFYMRGTWKVYVIAQQHEVKWRG